jgi:peptidoglycan/xylan/chitin deacetylase (PgdA/CDA1 family)
MRERAFADDPDGQVRAIVDAVRPGDIILAHDVGAERRLVALQRLGAMIEGIRARGFRFTTVSGLDAGPAQSVSRPPADPGDRLIGRRG